MGIPPAHLKLTSSLNIMSKKQLYLKAKEAYYNAEPIMSDKEFDDLEDQLKAKFPDWEPLHKTGVKSNKKTAIKLTHFMPSLRKAYPEVIGKWLKSNTSKVFVIMDKLDGSSLQVTAKNGKVIKVVTRGDGTEGGDISFLIPNLKLPSHLKDDGVYRCEAVMSKAVFNYKWAKKFENSRNLVNGVLNRRTPHPALKDIDIVVLGKYDATLSVGLHDAKDDGFATVPYLVSLTTPELLSALLAKRKSIGKYEVDGLVLAPTDFVLSYKDSDKPKNIIAFKFNDDENAQVVKVKRIIWQITGRSRIVPKIEIEPTKMDGVTVTYCAAHNAEWMTERGIGPGAKVKVLRSGGVIPKIVDVVRAGKFQPPSIPYKKDGKHFIVTDPSKSTTAEIDINNNLKFLKTLGIENIAKKTIDKLWFYGLHSPSDYLIALPEIETYFARAGFKANGLKIANDIKKTLSGKLSMRSVMVASQVFGVGIGDRKLKALEAAGISMEHLTKCNALPSTYAGEVKGFSTKTLELLDEGYIRWLAFYRAAGSRIDMDGSLPKKKPSVKAKHVVSMTGYRDANQVKWLESKGCVVEDFGSKTTVLLYKEGGKQSTKIEKAKAKGIQVLTFATFMSQLK